MRTKSFQGNRFFLAILLPLCAFRSSGQKPDLLLPVPGEKRQISQMLSDINQLRTQHHLWSLTLDARLPGSMLRTWPNTITSVIAAEDAFSLPAGPEPGPPLAVTNGRRSQKTS